MTDTSPPTGTGGKRSPVAALVASHAAKLVLRLGLVCAVGLAAAYALQMRFAGPTPQEYMARQSAASFVPAGALEFDGRPFSCGALPTVLNPRFEDYAAAFFGFLIVNPERFQTLPMTVKRFAHAHECGHQSVGYSEIAADCYAARLGKKEGWLDSKAMDEVCGFFISSKGSALHLPGPQRCEAIRRCHGE